MAVVDRPRGKCLSIRAAPSVRRPRRRAHVLQVQEGVEVLARAIGGSAGKSLLRWACCNFSLLVAEVRVMAAFTLRMAVVATVEDAFLGVVEYGAQPGFTVGDLLIRRSLPRPPSAGGAWPIAAATTTSTEPAAPLTAARGGRGLKRSPWGRWLATSGQTERQAGQRAQPSAEVQPACFLFGSRDLDPHRWVPAWRISLHSENVVRRCDSRRTTGRAGLNKLTRDKGASDLVFVTDVTCGAPSPSIVIRSSVAGWVENSPRSPPPTADS